MADSPHPSRQDSQKNQSSDSTENTIPVDSVMNMIKQSSEEYSHPPENNPAMYYKSNRDNGMPQGNHNYVMGGYQPQRQQKGNYRPRNNRGRGPNNNYGDSMNDGIKHRNSNNNNKQGDHYRGNVRYNQGMNNSQGQMQGKNYSRSYPKGNDNFGDMNRRDINHGRRNMPQRDMQ